MNTSENINGSSSNDYRHVDLQTVNLGGLRVMLVDDSKTIVRSAELFLAEKGCEVIAASDGFEALSIISEKKPDVIFMDIMMPRLDGYQTCAMIKSNDKYADIPIIMLSSKHTLFDIARGRLSGSEEYLTKPFDHDDLVKAILEHTHSLDNEQSPDSKSPEFV